MRVRRQVLHEPQLQAHVTGVGEGPPVRTRERRHLIAPHQRQQVAQEGGNGSAMSRRRRRCRADGARRACGCSGEASEWVASNRVYEGSRSAPPVVWQLSLPSHPKPDARTCAPVIGKPAMRGLLIADSANHPLQLMFGSAKCIIKHRHIKGVRVGLAHRRCCLPQR